MTEIGIGGLLEAALEDVITTLKVHLRREGQADL